MRRLRLLVSGVLLSACGDLQFDDTSTDPTTSPPGSTTTNGTVAASISGEQFFGRVAAAATVIEDRLEFSASDGSRQLALAFGAPGPGTFDAGGPYNPVVSLTETSGNETRRWVSSTAAGSGSVTLNFLTSYKAVGYFAFALFPDSATVAAGVTTRRSVTAGNFDINVSR